MNNRKSYDIGTIEGIASLLVDLKADESPTEMLIYIGPFAYVINVVSRRNRFTN